MDRRRRHHEEVRIRTLAPERDALTDPETMLLIDDGQRERRELDVRFDDGVGADHDVRFPGCDERAVPLPLRPG